MKLRKDYQPVKALSALKPKYMFCIPDLNDPSSLRIAFEKYSNFPKGSHLWTDRSKIVSVTGSDNSSSYRGKIQK